MSKLKVSLSKWNFEDNGHSFMHQDMNEETLMSASSVLVNILPDEQLENTQINIAFESKIGAYELRQLAIGELTIADIIQRAMSSKDEEE